MNQRPSDAEMDRAMRESDASYDGVFYTCVKTTGIFCRPSCPARKPLARNVEFVSSIEQAVLLGYRPCKRCRPTASSGEPPDWVESLLGRIDETPGDRVSDTNLRSMGLDPARARRYFQRHYGMTFHAYQRARRMGLALGQLKKGDDALGMALDHGYESNSGFRDAFEKTFGTTPGRVRGVDCIVTTMIPSPIGPLMAGATAEGICLLEFADRRAIANQLVTLRRRVCDCVVPGDNEHLEQLRTELDEYFDGVRSDFAVSLVAPGTPFQEQVWKRLCAIPCGETMSYDGLARAIGRPGAQRAVGRANGDNRIAILIPCHRVVQKDGQLRGYGGGLWRKRFLLDQERSMTAGVFANAS